MRQYSEISIRRSEIQSALTGDMQALVNLVTLPVEEFNQAAATFLLEQANLLIAEDPKNHCALTVKGFALSLAILGAEAGYDPQAALKCLETAASMGNPWALYLAGNIYRLGASGEIDFVKAAKCYRRALQILGDNEVVKSVFSDMHHNNNSTLSQMDANFDSYYEYCMCLGDISNARYGRAATLKKMLPLLYYDQDPALTLHRKLDYATRLSPLKSENIGQENDKDFLFAWAMLYAQAAKKALVSQEIDLLEEKINLANDCLDRLKYLKGDKPKILELEDAILMIVADVEQQNTDLDDPIAVVKTVNALLAVKIDTKKFFLLADFLMRLNTEEIFFNHKDKYRLIISLLSKVDMAERACCQGFDILLGQSICNLNNINVTNGINYQPAGVCVRVETVAELIGGPGCAKLITYTPDVEDVLLRQENAKRVLTDHFGSAQVSTFNRLLYNSYEDNFEGLDLLFLEEHLLAQFQQGIEAVQKRAEELQAAINGSKSKTFFPDDIKINHGNHGIIRKRLIARDKPAEGAAQHKRDLMVEALERAIAELEATMKVSTALYSQFAYYPHHLRVAKKLLEDCKLASKLGGVQSLVVKYLSEDDGKLHQYAFKMFFLRQLAQALNMGNIKTLETKPHEFLSKIRTFLNLECLVNNEAPAVHALAAAQVAGANAGGNNNNLPNNPALPPELVDQADASTDSMNTSFSH
jgi:hypothetical protein